MSKRMLIVYDVGFCCDEAGACWYEVEERAPELR